MSFLQAHKELKTQLNMAVSGGYNAVVNNVYGGNTHTPAPAYHSERAEVLSDMEATTANN